MAFSGWSFAWAGTVSSRTILLRFLFRKERSWLDVSDAPND